MIHITVVDASEYLFVVAITDAPPVATDLLKIKLRKIEIPYSETFPKKLSDAVMGSKGIVIVDATKLNWVTGYIVSESRNRVPWMAGHHRAIASVFNSTSPTKVVGEVFAASLLCLKCLESGVERYLRQDAVYSYCKEHQSYSPHK